MTTPTGKSDRPEAEDEPTLDRATTGQPPARNTFDPTQGREIGSSPKDDPTQGKEIGSEPYEDPTRTR